MADETLNKGPEGEKLPESPAPDGPGAPPAPEQAEHKMEAEHSAKTDSHI